MSWAAIDYATRQTGLSASESRVLTYLGKLHNEDKGYAWPSEANIAGAVEMTDRGVRKIVRRLEAMGHLQVEVNRGRGAVNLYFFPGLEDENRNGETSFFAQENRNSGNKNRNSGAENRNHAAAKTGTEEAGNRNGGSSNTTSTPHQKEQEKETDNSSSAGSTSSGKAGRKDHGPREDAPDDALSAELRALGLKPSKVKQLRAANDDAYLREKLALTRQRKAQGAIQSTLRFFLAAVRDDYDFIPDDAEDDQPEDAESLGRARAPGKLSTTLESLDRRMDGGLGKGQLAMLAAVIGTGKTQWLTFLASRLALGGKNVAYFSAEMTDVEIAEYIVGKMARLPFKFPERELGAEERENLIAAKRQAIDHVKVVYLDTKSARTPAAIDKDIRRMRRDGFEPEVILIDYAGKLKPSEESEQWQGERRVYEELGEYKAEWKVPVWTASQINRDGIGKTHIGKEHVAGGLEKLFDAEYVVVVSQTPEMLKSNKMRFYLAKARHSDGAGSEWTVHTDFKNQDACGLFSDTVFTKPDSDTPSISQRA